MTVSGGAGAVMVLRLSCYEIAEAVLHGKRLGVEKLCGHAVSMQSRQTTDVVLQALQMAVWRRKPKTRVLIHSDQGSQFSSMD
jgi:hypothetical protein